MKYRIVERTFDYSGDTKYVVEKQLNEGAPWESIFQSAELDVAKGVYKERMDRAAFTDKVLVE